MWKIVSVAEMQAVEREADAGGLSYSEMMQNAGRNLAEVIHAREGKFAGSHHILALVGPGNNGGDALVAVEALAGWGWQVGVCLLRPRPDDPLVDRVISAGGLVVVYGEDIDQSFIKDQLVKAHVILDGLLGTGTRLPLRDEYAQFLSLVHHLAVNRLVKPVLVAVDCPSGMDCDTGECAQQTLAADLTVTMAAVKQGLLSFPAAERVGDLQLVGIGPLDAYQSWNQIQSYLIDASWVRDHLPERPMNAHKGTFGTALICAGSLNYTGAAWLAGQAAYRAGAGLVTMAVPAPLHTVLAGQFPEATWLLLPEYEGFISGAGVPGLLEGLEKATSLLLGPGWGQHPSTGKFLNDLLQAELPPLVVDADALKLLAAIPDWSSRLPQSAILTPHPGEMAVLTGEPKASQANRLAYARRHARLWGHVVVLKGAYTVVASPNGDTGVIPFATPALARAGTGDILAGLITGLRAQGLPAFDAAVCGAWLHGRAGLLAAQMSGGNTAPVVAGDVLESVRHAFPAG